MKIVINKKNLSYPEEAINWLCLNYDLGCDRIICFNKHKTNLFLNDNSYVKYESVSDSWSYCTSYLGLKDYVEIEDEGVAMEFMLRFA